MTETEPSTAEVPGAAHDREGVSILNLNRPEKLNALTPAPFSELKAYKLAMSRILHGAASLQTEILGAEGMIGGGDSPRSAEAHLLPAERLLHVDRWRNRSDPAEHHRRATARIAQGAIGRPGSSVPGRSQGRGTP